MFENYRVFKTDLAGKPISFEVGKMCGLSNGSCLVRYGETTVLCNVTASQKPRDGIDFFPLSDRKSTRQNSSHWKQSRMPSSA
mgnify:CR=1 FL=1